MEHQIRMAVVGSRVPVDEDQPVPAVIIDEARRRVDSQAGARHDQQVGPVDGPDGLLDGVLIQAAIICPVLRIY